MFRRSFSKFLLSLPFLPILSKASSPPSLPEISPRFILFTKIDGKLICQTVHSSLKHFLYKEVHSVVSLWIPPELHPVEEGALWWAKEEEDGTWTVMGLTCPPNGHATCCIESLKKDSFERKDNVDTSAWKE